MHGPGAVLSPPAEPMTAGLDALTRLYDRNARTLISFFQRRVDDPELAVDLMSETFTLAIERRAQFRGESEEQLSGWLWSIAHSVLGEHERHHEVVSRNTERLGRERRQLSDREIERIEELAESEELRRVVARRLDLLPPDQREAVRLRVVEGLSYKEIAERLGITTSGARSRVGRSLSQLRYLLNFDFDDGGDTP